MNRSHKIRLYPNKAQAVLLRKTAGVTRYAYNWGLAKWNEVYQSGGKTSAYELSNLWTKERPAWSREVARAPQTKALINLGGAFNAFFKHAAKHPTFHKKGMKDSFYIDASHAKLYGKYAQLPNIGRVRLAEELRFAGCKINSYVVSQKAGKWYVSVQCEVVEDRRSESTEIVGVDVGIHHWAVASDGTVLDAPAKLKHYERQLKRKQRLLARKAKGSNNRAKARLSLSKTYQKINNIKQDTVHKFTGAIAKRYGIVCLETLDIEEMKKKHFIAKGIQASALGEVLRQLQYKCNNYQQVSQWYPSSKLCSACQSELASLALSERTYRCPTCGLTLDRDINAARNILHAGEKLIYGRSDR